MEKYIEAMRKLGFVPNATFRNPEEWYKAITLGKFEFTHENRNLTETEKKGLIKKAILLHTPLAERMLGWLETGHEFTAERLGGDPFKIRITIEKK